MPKINLLFLISGLERGGSELRLLDFAKHFPEDLNFHLCVMSNRIPMMQDFQKYTRNIKFFSIKRGYWELSKIVELYRHIKKAEISIINTFELKGLLVSVFIKWFGNAKLKIVHHAVNLLHNYKLKHRMALLLLLRFIDGLICNSNEGKKLFGKYIGNGKICRIYNGIDTNHYSKGVFRGNPLKVELGIMKDEVVLGTVANFRKEKNYPFLLSTFRKLLAIYPNLKLLCVGGGMLLEEMKGVVRENGMEEKVIFSGYCLNVAEYLDIMDIFVLVSSMESLPNALIQAMSMGLPAISTRVGGCSEVIDNMVDGVLIEPNNYEDLIFWVGRLINEQGLTAMLGRNAIVKIRNIFSLEEMLKNYSNFYRKLCTR